MKKAFIIALIIVALQFVAAVVLYIYLPQQIPMHWNSNGEIDRMGDKLSIFLLPTISLAITLMLHWQPRLVPKGENILKSGKLYPILMVLMPLLMAAVLAMTAAASFGISTPIGAILNGFLGVLMLLIGNYLPKVKQNYTLGIRLSWTLANEATWVKTHRFGGWIFIGIGVLFIGAIFIPAPVNALLPLVGLFAGILAITAFAYITYKKTGHA